MTDEVKDPVGFVAEAVRSALWSVSYHERALPKAQRKLEFAKELLVRVGVDYDAVQHTTEENDEGDPIANSVEQFVCNIYDEEMQTVQHHETRLKEAHDHVAFVTVLLARGKYVEIDVEKIRKDVNET